MAAVMNPSFHWQNFTLRFLERGDVDGITEYYCRNRAHLTPWEPTRSEDFFLREGWAFRLAQLAKLQRCDWAYYFVIVDDVHRRICGVVNVSHIVHFPFFAGHLGYSLDEAYQGQGIMTRAVQYVVSWLFSEGFHRVMAGYMPRNKRSAAILSRCGFKKEGLARAYLLINGQWEDHILTACINPHWVER